MAHVHKLHTLHAAFTCLREYFERICVLQSRRCQLTTEFSYYQSDISMLLDIMGHKTRHNRRRGLGCCHTEQRFAGQS